MDEIERLLAQMSSRDRLICRCFLTLGLRPGELFAVKWEDFDRSTNNYASTSGLGWPLQRDKDGGQQCLGWNAACAGSGNPFVATGLRHRTGLSKQARHTHRHQELPPKEHLASRDQGRYYAGSAERLAKGETVGRPFRQRQLPGLPKNLRYLVSRTRQRQRRSVAPSPHNSEHDVEALPEGDSGKRASCG